MTITPEEFAALPQATQQKYLAAAHGMAVRMAPVIRQNDNHQIVGKCLEDMRSIRREAKGLDVKTKDLS